jgi:hypothetical protein
MTRKYINDPELKPKVYFWRNNVMHGSRVKLGEEPPVIPLKKLDGAIVLLSEILD